jgi:hypothetical protein
MLAIAYKNPDRSADGQATRLNSVDPTKS